MGQQSPSPPRYSTVASQQILEVSCTQQEQLPSPLPCCTTGMKRPMLRMLSVYLNSVVLFSISLKSIFHEYDVCDVCQYCFSIYGMSKLNFLKLVNCKTYMHTSYLLYQIILVSKWFSWWNTFIFLLLFEALLCLNTRWQYCFFK